MQLQGYEGFWGAEASAAAAGAAAAVSPQLQCLPQALPPRAASWSPAFTAAAVLGGLLVLAAAAVLLVNTCRPRGYRSATKRALDHVKWRLQGLPKSGTISVVVTDIEGYSGGCWQGGGSLLLGAVGHGASRACAAHAFCTCSMPRHMTGHAAPKQGGACRISSMSNFWTTC
jgi:hypothetical protein